MLSEVVGQSEGVRFLRRVVERKYSSALLLVGDDGVGRKFSVLQTAKELFCSGTKQPGCDCYDCAQIDMGTHPDFLVVAPEKESREIKVSQIRELIENASTFPSIAPLRLILLDGADIMNTEAANALLKTLEEPPAFVRFFLLARRSNRVIGTIRSRCGLVRFRPLSEEFVLSRVLQSPSLSGEPDERATKALVCTRMGEGSVGRAIGYLASNKLGLRDRVCALLDAGLKKDLPSVFSITSSVDKELPLVLRFLEQLLHDVMMVRHSPDRLINSDLAESLRQTSARSSPVTLQRLSMGVRKLNERGPSSRINLQFHLQTLFVETFFGV